jgi:hypothetical protein
VLADTIHIVVDTTSISMFVKTHTYVRTYIHTYRTVLADTEDVVVDTSSD